MVPVTVRSIMFFPALLDLNSLKCILRESQGRFIPKNMEWLVLSFTDFSVNAKP